MALASDDLSAAVREIRERIRSRYPEQSLSPDLPLPDLMPLLHARDSAEAKVASIGAVNPRPGGPINAVIQFVKRQISRGLFWFIRDQIEFNRSAVNSMDATLEVLNDVRRCLADAGTEAHTKSEVRDMRAHWIEWRESWEKRLHQNEAHFLRSAAELNAAFDQRLMHAESNFRDNVRVQHNDYLAALERSNTELQQRLRADMEKVRLEYERLIHHELRLIRQRASAPPSRQSEPELESFTEFDYTRFAEKFRGSEDYVRQGQRFYVPHFSDCSSVLDIGSGRGEFLELMRDAGIPAHGIDLDSASVELCLAKGLSAEVANLFEYLNSGACPRFDGIFAAQLAEHLAPGQLPRMIKLCAERLKPGGVLVLETPNPECLAIFATHFYIDPTHTRPIPPELMAFYFEEFGLGRIEVHRRFPAAESMPQVRELGPKMQEKFFGGLDYAIIGRKL
jgi:2-polyprenyl-3-methyl-5-hydroxy-6-metoxy-1,4-benzoquinol methylase